MISVVALGGWKLALPMCVPWLDHCLKQIELALDDSRSCRYLYVVVVAEFGEAGDIVSVVEITMLLVWIKVLYSLLGGGVHVL